MVPCPAESGRPADRLDAADGDGGRADGAEVVVAVTEGAGGDHARGGGPRGAQGPGQCEVYIFFRVIFYGSFAVLLLTLLLLRLLLL